MVVVMVDIEVLVTVETVEVVTTVGFWLEGKIVVVTGQVVTVVKTLYQGGISLHADTPYKQTWVCLHLGCGCQNNWS